MVKKLSKYYEWDEFSNSKHYTRYLLTEFMEHEFLLVLFEELCRSGLVQEQWVHSFDIIYIHFHTLYQTNKV